MKIKSMMLRDSYLKCKLLNSKPHLEGRRHILDLDNCRFGSFYGPLGVCEEPKFSGRRI